MAECFLNSLIAFDGIPQKKITLAFKDLAFRY